MNDFRFSREITPDYDALLRCIRRQGTPKRVHYLELFLDGEVKEVICARFGLEEGLDRASADFGLQREIAIQRFLGYDYIRCGVDPFDMPLRRHTVADTAALAHAGGRSFMDNQTGPITNWQEFDAYPWPDASKLTTHQLEWCEHNLPDGMCVISSGGFAHYAEYLTWLMGYETLCIALYEQRDLVKAISDKLRDFYRHVMNLLLQFPCVKAAFGSDDMGFRTGTLISPDHLREFVLPGHAEMAAAAHAAGRPYLLHCCGNIEAIMPDLLDVVKIDAKHSFEDIVMDVASFRRKYGQRVTALGGIDVDFLCRADEQAVRQRVHQTLDACQGGGGYCLGTGNSVANYIPVENYLAMLDEGRRWGA